MKSGEGDILNTYQIPLFITLDFIISTYIL